MIVVLTVVIYLGRAQKCPLSPWKLPRDKCLLASHLLESWHTVAAVKKHLYLYLIVDFCVHGC